MWERNQHSQHPRSVRILDLHFTFVDLYNPQRQFYGVGIIFTLELMGLRFIRLINLSKVIVNVRSQDTGLAYIAEKGTGGRESWLSAAV